MKKERDALHTMDSSYVSYQATDLGLVKVLSIVMSTEKRSEPRHEGRMLSCLLHVCLIMLEHVCYLGHKGYVQRDSAESRVWSRY